jgi:hypothetical protein
MTEMKMLMQRFDDFISTMNEFTATIKSVVPPLVPGPVPVEPRRRLSSLNVRQAAEKVLELFKNTETLYYSDIAERLNISLQTAIEACDLLEQQGRIQGANDGSTRPKRPRDRDTPKAGRRTRGRAGSGNGA